MEANEALRRIFWRHRWLLILCLVLPAVGVAALRTARPPAYAATASIQAQSAPLQVQTEQQAILSRVSAVATSPAVVHTALLWANADRNPLDVARHEVSATSLGTSAVVELTVTDPSRPVAIRLATQLAAKVVSTLNRLGGPAFTPQMSALARQQRQLAINKSRLLSQLQAAEARTGGSSSPAVSSLLTELTAVESQLSAVISAQQQLVVNGSAGGGAAVISAPVIATAVPSSAVVYAALAGLAGLVLGLLIATIHELARPTVAEPGAAATELGVSLLGNVGISAGGQMTVLDDDLPARIDLAAQRTGARTLVLTGPVPPARLAAAADCLNAALRAGARPAPHDMVGAGCWAPSGGQPAGTGAFAGDRAAGMRDERDAAPSADGNHSAVAVAVAGWDRPGASAPPGLTAVALAGLPPGARPKMPALIVVLPPFAPHSAVDRAADLRATTGWPCLGVLGLRRRRRGRKGRAAAAADRDQG